MADVSGQDDPIAEILEITEAVDGRRVCVRRAALCWTSTPVSPSTQRASRPGMSMTWHHRPPTSSSEGRTMHGRSSRTSLEEEGPAVDLGGLIWIRGWPPRQELKRNAR